jgi:hypothetical protein
VDEVLVALEEDVASVVALPEVVELAVELDTGKLCQSRNSERETPERGDRPLEQVSFSNARAAVRS